MEALEKRVAELEKKLSRKGKALWTVVIAFVSVLALGAQVVGPVLFNQKVTFQGGGKNTSVVVDPGKEPIMVVKGGLEVDNLNLAERIEWKLKKVTQRLEETHVDFPGFDVIDAQAIVVGIHWIRPGKQVITADSIAAKIATVNWADSRVTFSVDIGATGPGMGAVETTANILVLARVKAAKKAAKPKSK